MARIFELILLVGAVYFFITEASRSHSKPTYSKPGLRVVRGGKH